MITFIAADQTSLYCVVADELKEVLEERTACLYHQALQFSCPEDHIVVLRRAYYLLGQSEGCNPLATDVCEVTPQGVTSFYSLEKSCVNSPAGYLMTKIYM